MLTQRSQQIIVLQGALLHVLTETEFCTIYATDDGSGHPIIKPALSSEIDEALKSNDKRYEC